MCYLGSEGRSEIKQCAVGLMKRFTWHDTQRKEEEVERRVICMSGRASAGELDVRRRRSHLFAGPRHSNLCK